MPTSTSRTTAKGVPSSPTSASKWKKQTTGGTLITVPSGNTALVRAPGMGAFLEHGVIPNALLPLIQEAMSKGKAPADDALNDLVSDPAKLQDIISLADSVTVHCCLDPVVAPAPLDTEGNILPFTSPDRDEAILYVDEVDFNDKMFIFNFAVGGTADLEKFREEQTAHVESVSQ